MSDHFGFGHEFTEVEGGVIPAMGLWFVWMSNSTRVSKFIDS